jgi:tRNA modification GTPase
MSSIREEKTIAAPATAPGQAGIAVIRVSGEKSLDVLRGCFSHAGPYEPRRMHYGSVLLHGQAVDQAMAVFFKAPHSYTGEDMAEIQCHGGQETVRAALEAVYAAGASPAEPGEFTKRAFLNGRMDLSQAEAVMDLISARAEGARRLALGQLEGRLGRRVTELQDELLLLLAEIEVTVDYPEENVEEQTSQKVKDRLYAISGELDTLLMTARAGRALREGVRCAIVGRPNAGKSSLLNALLGEDRAIVTARPGTTRDTLDAEANIRGLPVLFTDTAGIRHSHDEIEVMGVERARRAIASSSLVILVVDGTTGVTAEDREICTGAEGIPVIMAINKADLPMQASPEEAAAALPCAGAVAVSALTGQGISALQDMIYETAAGREEFAESTVLSNLRHIEATREASEALALASTALEEGFPPDTAATDIRRAWHALGQVTGRTVDEDVVDLIFERFCLGK